MNGLVIRTAAYAGLLGLVVGIVLGIGVTRLHLPWLDFSRFEAEASQYDPEFLKQFNLQRLQVPRRQLLRGGPAKDGIPSLTNPEFVHVSDVDFLEPDDRIVAVTKNNEHRAYPMRLLNWHEIVNDELGSVPIAVIYCPLCDSVSVVDRRVEGQTLNFGVSGLLYQSNVLMYDRKHDALWSQIKLEAVSGPYAGTALRHYGWSITEFDRWREQHPEGTVLTFETDHQRDYGRNPYENYFTHDRLMFDVKHEDDRLARKDRVIGVRYGEITRAYPLQAVYQTDDHRLVDSLGGGRITIQADSETGDVSVVEFPDDAHTIHTFWFSWVAAHPETDIFGLNGDNDH